MVLFRHQWKSARWTIATWCVTIGLLMWLLLAMYRVLESSGTLEEFARLVSSMPPIVRSILGSQDIAFFDTFIAGMSYGWVMSIIMIIFLSTYVPGLITQEIDRRSSEFLLSLPVKRQTVLLAKWLGLAVSVAILTAVHWVSLVAATGAQAQPVRYLLASTNMFCLYLEIGTLLLLASIYIDEYPKSAGVCAGIVTGLFFLNVMTEKTTGLVQRIREALPFARFSIDPILVSGKAPVADTMILAAGTAVLLYLAIRAFDSKQIAG